MPPAIQCQIKCAGVQTKDCHQTRPSKSVLHVCSAILCQPRKIYWCQFSDALNYNATKDARFLQVIQLSCPTKICNWSRASSVQVFERRSSSQHGFHGPFLRTITVFHNKSIKTKTSIAAKNLTTHLSDYLPMYSPFTNASTAWPRLATLRTGTISLRTGRSRGLTSILRSQLHECVTFLECNRVGDAFK